jgi:hypothetical protein
MRLRTLSEGFIPFNYLKVRIFGRPFALVRFSTEQKKKAAYYGAG